MYEIFERIINEKGITPYRVAKATGIGTATLSSWKKGTYTPKQDKLQKIADFLDVSIEFLMTGKEPGEDKVALTNEEKIDISKDMEKYSNLIKSNKGGPLYFNGKEIDEETKNLFLHELESALKSIALLNRIKDK